MRKQDRQINHSRRRCRRQFLRSAVVSAAVLTCRPALALSPSGTTRSHRPPRRPNVLFVFADQWRAQALGYAANPDVRTPNLDRLARRAVNFANAVSGCPVCCPYRASLLTGQYPLTHGVFLNDVPLRNDALSIARLYAQAGYDTAYIGKWHLNGQQRRAYIPPEARQGFQFFRAIGCTHDYNNSYYFADDDPRPRKWPGYDAIAQTEQACTYLRSHPKDRPFLLFLSWGPPHAPYHTAPEKYKALFDPAAIHLRPNVPAEHHTHARNALAGYYAHIAALDDCIGRLLQTLHELGLEDDTIFVFTSDHGDMLYSHGYQKKQQPWDESIRIPFLLRYPARLGNQSRTIHTPINTPDILPTLLDLCGIQIPATVEGTSFLPILTGTGPEPDNAALITCPSPFGQWKRSRGGREYRGIRTRRYTYVRDLTGPWLLYDNLEDPYQLRNLVNRPEYADLQKHLDQLLDRKLKQTNDQFLPGPEYIKQWGYQVDESGTVPYSTQLIPKPTP